MKIIKRAGERPDTPRLHRRIAAEVRPILTFTGAGAALIAGSGILLRSGWHLLSQHLAGWERLGALAFAGYAAVYAASHAPNTARFAIPAGIVAWCIAAWWVAPPPAHAQLIEQADEEPEELTLDELATLVRRVAEDRQGAHLADLLAEPELVGWTQPELKATATALGTPVGEFKLILAGRQRVRDGIRVRDLPPDPPLAAPADPSPEPLPAPAPEPG